MAKANSALPDENAASAWLKANSQVIEKAIERCNLDNLRLCDALALRPDLYLELASNTYKEAQAANAPKTVLMALKTQVACVKRGLNNLPAFAYTWLMLMQLRGIESTAKAQSILKRALLRAPDLNNKKALEAILETVVYRKQPNGNVEETKASVAARMRFNKPRCGFCCILGCLECGPYCLACCAIGCLICGLDI